MSRRRDLIRKILLGDSDAYEDYFHLCRREGLERHGHIFPHCYFCTYSEENYDKESLSCTHPEFFYYERWNDLCEKAGSVIPRDFDIGAYDWTHHHGCLKAIFCRHYNEKLDPMVPCERCGALLEPPASQHRCGPQLGNRVLCGRCQSYEIRKRPLQKWW